MNIAEAFSAIKDGKRVQYVLTGRAVVMGVLGNLCWEDTGGDVLTHDHTYRDDAFEVIEPTWKKATLREAFAALVAGRTVSSDRNILDCRYRFTIDGHGLVDGYGNPAYVWTEELEPGTQWYIMEDE